LGQSLPPPNIWETTMYHASFFGLILGIAAVAQAGPMSLGTIMPMGDSITIGLPTPGGYRDQLYQDLTSAGFSFTLTGTSTENPSPALTAAGDTRHCGIHSYSIEQTTADLPLYFAADPSPNYILLLIGTNDFVGNATQEANAIGYLDTLLDDIVSHSPTTNIIVSNLILRANSSAEGRINTLFNPFVPGLVATHAAAGEHVSSVDMHAIITAADISEDNVHPNGSGCTKLGDGWFNAIRAVAEHCPGDANLNGTVDGADLNIVLSDYNQTGMNWSQGDFNGDGTVNGADLNAVLSNYNQQVNLSSSGGWWASPNPPRLPFSASVSSGCRFMFGDGGVRCKPNPPQPCQETHRALETQGLCVVSAESGEAWQIR
jgi:hypothetical protein